MDLKRIHEDLKGRFKQGSGYQLVDAYSEEWSDYFQKCFVHNEEHHWDDLLFYVVRRNKAMTVETHRRNSKSLPSETDGNVNWEETTFLNYLMHGFEYNLTSAIGESEADPKSKNTLKVHNSVSHKVYPSVAKRRMDLRGEETSVSYPVVLFQIDSYAEVFKDIVATSVNQEYAMELTAVNMELGIDIALFGGKVPYPVVKRVHETKAKGPVFEGLRKRLGSLVNRHAPSYQVTPSQILRMTSPDKHGCAEVAVTLSNPKPIVMSNLTATMEDSDNVELTSDKYKNEELPVEPGLAPLNAQLMSVEMTWEAIMQKLLYTDKKPDLPHT